MSPSECKFGVAMVKFRTLPLLGCMTGRAILRETRFEVVGIRRPIVIRLMTSDTLCTRACVFPIRVALSTVGIDMSTRQREAGLRMVKLRPFPLLSGVANRAISRKIGGYMTGQCCAFKIFQVTGDTVCGSSRKPATDMALSAID